MGYLFQDYALFPNMTVRQNISCAVRGKEKEKLAQEQIHNFQLEGLEDQYPHQLSGGTEAEDCPARMMPMSRKPFFWMNRSLPWTII